MADLVLFFIFLLSSIFDVSFLPQFSFFGAIPLAALAVTIFYAVSSKKNNFLWVIIPTVVLSIYSNIHIVLIFSLFVSAYFVARLSGNRFRENRYLQLTVKAFLSTIVFLFGYSIILLYQSINLKIYSLDFAVKIIVNGIVFIFAQLLLFMAIVFLTDKFKNRINLRYD